jgi:hypothetical protein
MSDVLQADPRDITPPQELNWGSTLADFLGASYNFSEELVDPAKPPRFIRMFADRWQANWQVSGISDPEAQTVIDIFITVRPVAPAEITIKA